MGGGPATTTVLRALAGLMILQAVTGLLFPGQYRRDPDWIAASWFGNDWVTLALAVPMLLGGMFLAARGSTRGQLVALAAVGYTLYNFAFYLFGAALNVSFPLYVALVVMAIVALVLALSRLDAPAMAARFREQTPVRALGGCLLFIAAGLTTVWLGTWAGYAFAGRPTPVDPEVFKLVAALDLSLMVPALAFGGILLWRRHPWGFVVAAIASVQGALYLLVLTVNSLVLIARGLADAPGETPVWGALALFTAGVAAALLANVRGRCG